MSETKEAEDHISIEVPRMSRLIYNLLAARTARSWPSVLWRRYWRGSARQWTCPYPIR